MKKYTLGIVIMTFVMTFVMISSVSEVSARSIPGDADRDGSLTCRDFAITWDFRILNKIAGNGDIDANGIINKADANLIQEIVVGKTQYSSDDATWYCEHKVADVSRNGRVSSYDAAKLLQQLNVKPEVSISNDGTSALIGWSSLRAGTGRVEYFPVFREYQKKTVYDVRSMTSHSVELRNLSVGEIYGFRAFTTDAYGVTTILGENITDEFTFYTYSR